MNLSHTGKLFCELRKSKGMTQKALAERLGVMPKTVSKWETGKGFPDVAMVSQLADVLGVSERTILSGQIKLNRGDSGNIRNLKFYLCSFCGSLIQGTGEFKVNCCGKSMEPVLPKPPDDLHLVNVSVCEDDYYIELNHEMTKDHHISFVVFVCYDRFLTIRLYPEQEAVVRFPKRCRGKLYYYCTKHGLYSINI